MNPGTLPNAEDVQRPIIYPYQYNYSRHFFLAVHDQPAARNYLESLIDHELITVASKTDTELKKEPMALNIGFTYAGLEALGLPEPYLRVFQEKAKAFAEGPNLRAARRLADTGPSAAPWWEVPFKHRRIHIYLLAHVADLEGQELSAVTADLESGKKGIHLCGSVVDGAHLTKTPDKRFVHFGFRDNVANPTIKGWPLAENEPDRPKSQHAPGEFVLGYQTNNDFNPWLLVSPYPATTPWLLPRAEINPAFFWNGSFGVFRKMKQDVTAFETHVAKWADRLIPPASHMGEKERRAYVRAKICGRWDDGQVVGWKDLTAPHEPPADLDKFDFSDDPKGEGCPFGSHIRRMNPRSDRVVPTRRRPLIRRGMPYGEPADKECGLLGMFFCASLEDQFEHLLCEWGDANPMGPPNRGTSRDPFTGAYGDERMFDIPVDGEDLQQFDGFGSFVTTRGTVYAFFPSLSGICLIARQPDLEE
jgi:deferrochelatase/peroxidase EfeB